MTRCPVSQAEIDNDTMTEAEEQAMYAQNAVSWRIIYGLLITGFPVDHNGMKVTLRDRLIDEYQEFADLSDIEIISGGDFMKEFIRGELDITLSNLIRQEAKTLASIIVG